MNELVKETEALVDVAVMGKQIDDFIRSDVGQFFIKRIDAEAAEGYAELREVSPSNAQAVMQAQNKVHRAEAMKLWITGAIEDGIRATGILESREDD